MQGADRSEDEVSVRVARVLQAVSMGEWLQIMWTRQVNTGRVTSMPSPMLLLQKVLSFLLLLVHFTY